VDIYLLVVLVLGCTNGQAVCNTETWPTISWLIRETYNDRLFCIITTIMCYVCMSGNIRAFHKRIAPFTSELTNDILLYLGTIAIFCLPLVGLFDMVNSPRIHVVVAVAFFAGFGIYSIWISRIMAANKDKFTPEQGKAIDAQVTFTRLYFVAFGIFGALIWSTGKTDPYGPMCEWVYCYLLVNYFLVLSYDNEFYDSVANYASKD